VPVAAWLTFQQETMQLEAPSSRPDGGLVVAPAVLNYSAAYFGQIVSCIQIYLNLLKKQKTPHHWANNPVSISDSDLDFRQSSD